MVHLNLECMSILELKRLRDEVEALILRKEAPARSATMGLARRPTSPARRPALLDEETELDRALDRFQRPEELDVKLRRPIAKGPLRGLEELDIDLRRRAEKAPEDLDVKLRRWAGKGPARNPEEILGLHETKLATTPPRRSTVKSVSIEEDRPRSPTRSLMRQPTRVDIKERLADGTVIDEKIRPRSPTRSLARQPTRVDIKEKLPDGTVIEETIRRPVRRTSLPTTAARGSVLRPVDCPPCSPDPRLPPPIPGMPEYRPSRRF